MRQDAFHELYLPPVSGLTPETRAASETGAEKAAQQRTAKIERLREAWRTPRTMLEVAEATGLPLSSVCSLKHAIRRELAFEGYRFIVWADGTTTKRTMWRMR